jgi:hypothetical protein
MSNDTLLRSFGGAALTDDAVFTIVGPGLADTQLDPWMFDPDQGFGVDAVELSRDLRTVVGIAGTSDEKLRVYRTTMHPFGAPDWNHAPFAQGNVPVVQRCSEIDGAKFESTSLAPNGRALAYGTADGIWIAAIPDACTQSDRGTLVLPGATSPDWGPADLPAAAPAVEHAESPAAPAKPKRARLRVTRHNRRLVATLTTGTRGRAKFTVKRARRTLAKRTVRIGASGRARVRFKVRGRVTVKARFTPTRGPAQTLTARAK